MPKFGRLLPFFQPFFSLIVTRRDLADIHNDGLLTRDGFAIAMHLIQRKLAGHDLPFTLPPSLIPPSLRTSMLDQSPFSPTNVQTQPEPVVNLLELEDTPPPSASHSRSMLKPQITGPISTPRQSVSQVPDNDPFSVPFQPCKFDGHSSSCPQTHNSSSSESRLFQRRYFLSTLRPISRNWKRPKSVEFN